MKQMGGVELKRRPPSGRTHNLSILCGIVTFASSVYCVMASPSAGGSLPLKLVIDKGRSKVLYAEAGKDFVDFLFFLLSLPLGEAFNLLAKDSLPAGSSGNVYESLENLDDSFLLATPEKRLVKNELLHPVYSPIFPSVDLNLRQSDIQVMKRKYFVCQRCKRVKPVESDATCYGCGYSTFFTEVVYSVEPITPSSTVALSGGGVVKDSLKYMITDDLVLTPMDTNALLPLLNKIGTGDITALEHRTVKVGAEEGKAILRSSLNSKAVFTDVFLGRRTAVSMADSTAVPTFTKKPRTLPTQ